MKSAQGAPARVRLLQERFQAPNSPTFGPCSGPDLEPGSGCARSLDREADCAGRPWGALAESGQRVAPPPPRPEYSQDR